MMSTMKLLFWRPNKSQPSSETRFMSWWRNCGSFSMDKRPSFWLWLRVTLPDILTMVVLGIIAIMVFPLPPLGTRTFPLTLTSTGEVVYPQFAYPYRPQLIPSWLDGLLGAAVPIISILLAQIRIRSFWDLNNAIIGLVYALETSTVCHVVIKNLIGGLRPHFYDVCMPDPALATQFNTTGLNAVGYQSYMFTAEICTSGNQEGINNSLLSFPSGHATIAFAAFVYLYLYLNAKLKVFANYHPAMWKLALLYCPILGACLIGGSLTVDQSHNWYDIVAGAIIGTIFAFSAYRMVYAAVWNWRINHIPLNRGTAFAWSGKAEASNLVLTGRAGWRARRREGDLLPLSRESGSLEDKQPAGTTQRSPSLRGDEMV